jgi:hypothetical protein
VQWRNAFVKITGMRKIRMTELLMEKYSNGGNFDDFVLKLIQLRLHDAPDTLKGKYSDPWAYSAPRIR